MKLKLTLDIFSGRENPSFILQGKDAANLTSKIKFGADLKVDLKELERPTHLGYRGIRVEQMDKVLSKSIPRIVDLHDTIAVSDKKIMQLEDVSAIEEMIIKKQPQQRSQDQ